jgi:hypothetical protein
MLIVRAYEMIRMTPSFLWFAFASAVLLFGTPSSALADISEWYTDAAESTDGRYLFVSLSNRPLDVELKDEGLTGEERDQIEHFRLYYPVSGMYLNDNSNTPLWKFDEPWRGEPIVAPDGEHVIFQGGWTSPSNEQDSQAVEFTRRGKSIRSHVVSDFISSWQLKRLLNGGRAPTCKSTNFDPAELTYTIATNQGEEYVFNVKNGKLLEVRSPFPLYYTIFGVVIAGLIIAPAYWIRRRKARAGV